MSLPDNLAVDYLQIMQQFDQLKDSWNTYADGMIPEDKEYARDIAQFMVNVIDHILENYEETELEEWRQFLASFHYNFYYGPNGDDRNYLEFAEEVNGEKLAWFCYDLKQSFDVPKEILEGLKQKYLEVLKQLQ